MNFWPKKLRIFLSHLNEISEGCERDSRKRSSERSLRKLWAFTNRLTYDRAYFRAITGYFVYYPSNVLQRAGKNLTYFFHCVFIHHSFVFIPLYSKWSNSKVEVGLLGREIAFCINLLFDYFPLLQSEFGNKMGNGFFLNTHDNWLGLTFFLLIR